MHKKGHILVLSTIDYGGAGIGARLVADDLRENGYDVDFLVFAKRQRNNDTNSFINIQNSFIFLVFRIFWFLYRKFVQHVLCKGVVEDNVFSANHACISAMSILKKIKKHPDLILIGWTDFFVSTYTVNRLHSLTHAHIAYLMIDNYPITGGCHYPHTCNGYQKNCINCPIIGRKNYAYRILCQKQKDLKNVSLCVLGTTNDCNRAKLSALFGNARIFPVVQANNMPEISEKRSLRKKFSLNESDFVILFGAQDVKSKRKGFSYLVEALKLFAEKIEEEQVILLVAGNCLENLNIDPKKIKVKQIGYVNLVDLYSAYAASDVFVCPSIEDSGPMMINYSIGLGVPVIAFKMGVALDMVVSGKTGYLIDLYDVHGMADAILKMYKLDNQEQLILRQNCLLFYERIQKEKSLVNVVEQILSKNY